MALWELILENLGQDRASTVQTLIGRVISLSIQVIGETKCNFIFMFSQYAESFFNYI